MIVCSRHGEVELSLPDSNGNCYCHQCKEEIIAKAIEEIIAKAIKSAPPNLANNGMVKIREQDLTKMIDLLVEAFSSFELIENMLSSNDNPNIDKARKIALQQIKKLRNWRND